MPQTFQSRPRHSALSWRQPTRIRPSHPRWAALVQLIHNLAFFRTLPQHLIRRLLMRMTLQYLPMEATVCRQGDIGAFMGVVMKGELAVLASSQPSQPLERIATLTVSDAFGSQSLIDGAPRQASVVCMVECELAILTRRDYLEVLMHRHEAESDRIEANKRRQLLASDEDPKGEEEEAEGEEELSLLDPAFLSAAGLPDGFDLYPHLNNYIDILTSQTKAIMAAQHRRSMSTFTALSSIDEFSRAVPASPDSSSSLGMFPPMSPTGIAAFQKWSSANAAPAPPSLNDMNFLLNLLKTCKHLQMHDRRPILLELTKKMTLHHYPANTVLFELGSKATDTLFVLSGSVAEMSTNSYSYRHRSHAERKSKREAVRALIQKWEDADRKQQLELERARKNQPNFMTLTAQSHNAMKDNAELIQRVLDSTQAQQKDAERREKVRAEQERRDKQIYSLMREYELDTLASSEDEEEQGDSPQKKWKDTDPSSSLAASSSSPHQFPLGSCRAVLLYPDHLGFADTEAHLHALQDERLRAQVALADEFGRQERERAEIISAAIKKGHQSLGSGLSAEQQAAQILEENRREKERRAAEQEKKRREAEERELERQQTKKGGWNGHHRRKSSITTSSSHAPSSNHPSSSLLSPNSRNNNQLPPVYLSPTFDQVCYSTSCVTRESCWIARLPNSAVLEAMEAPFHGVTVTEKLNDPILRYTVMRPQEASSSKLTQQQQLERIDPEDPDKILSEKKASISSKAAASLSGKSIRLDYSHHIERLFNSMQHLKFFSIQNRELGLKLCSRMQYLSLNTGDILCKQGQLGSLFYIIMSGTVAVHIKPQFVVPQLDKVLMDANARTRKLSKKARRKMSQIDMTSTDATGTVVAEPPRPPSLDSVGDVMAQSPANQRVDRQGSVMVQSTMFPTTSPVEQMKQQEREQKDGEAAAAAITSPKGRSDRQGSVMVQSLMFPSTSPTEQMKRQEKEQQEGEEALKSGSGKDASATRKPHVLDGFTPNLSQLADPPSVLAKHLAHPHSSISYLTQLESLYGPCVKVAQSGDPIGESAIVSNNPRSATCICREPVELFTLSKDDYRAIYATPQHLKVNTILNLVQKTSAPGTDEDSPLTTKEIILLEHCIRDIDFMKPLHTSIRSTLCQRLHLLQLPAGHVIVEQGKPGYYLYIILSGTCSVYMKPPVSTPVAQPTRKQLTAATPERKPLSALETSSPSTPAIQSPTIESTNSATAVASRLKALNVDGGEKPIHSPIPFNLDGADAAKSESKSIEPEVSKLSSQDPTPSPSGMSSAERAVAAAKAALAESAARPGAEMLSQTNAKTFKFSTGARGGTAGGVMTAGGTGFSAGRIKPSQLEAFPPVTDINLSDQEAEYLHGLGPVTSILSVGAHFGEAALQPGGNGLQTSTVVTNGPTDVVLLTRSSYNYAMDSLIQWKSDLDEVFTFLKSMYYFHNFSPTLLSKAMNLMERREIHRGETFIKQGEPATHIWFVLKGEVNVRQNVHLVDKELEELSYQKAEVKIPSPTDPKSPPPISRTNSVSTTTTTTKPKKSRSRVSISSVSESKENVWDDLEVELPTDSNKKPKSKKESVSIQTILTEQRLDAEAYEIRASAHKAKKLKYAYLASVPPFTNYPVRSQNGLVGSLLRPEYGLPLFVPTLTAEDPVPLIANSNHLSNFSSLITVSQIVDGMHPLTPIVDGGQIWLYYPQQRGYSYSVVSSGCKRRSGMKKTYKPAKVNELQNSSNKSINPTITNAAPGTTVSSDSSSSVGSSPSFPFTIELSSLSRSGICGNLATLLPSILGVRDLLGRPETDEELARERERKEREAYAVEHGEPIPVAQTNGQPAGSQATQCQLPYTATYTAFTDCTLVAFPTNAFHTLLSLTEETQFYQLYLDRLQKNTTKIRSWLEGHILVSGPPFTKSLLEDYRIYEENVYYSLHRNSEQDTAIVQQQNLNALLRPGAKPPAVVDYHTEGQLKSLKAAGLANHPYALSLETTLKKHEGEHTDSFTSSNASFETDQPKHELSFSVMGNSMDYKYSATLSQYVPNETQAGLKKGKHARAMLETICQVSQTNATLPSIPPTVAAEFGRAVFDPMTQSLPTQPSHTPEFLAALRYAERHAANRAKKYETGGDGGTKEALATRTGGLSVSQSVPFLPQMSAHKRMPSSPSPTSSSTVVSPTAMRASTPSPLPRSDSAASHLSPPTSPSPYAGGPPSRSSSPLPPVSLSGLANEEHSARFFTKTSAAARNPNAAAGMVTQLLTNEPHELEQFLSHLKRQHGEEDLDIGLPSSMIKKSHRTTSIILGPLEQQELSNSTTPTPHDLPTPASTATSGPGYGLTSAVLALQSKTSLSTHQTEAHKEYTRRMATQRSEKKINLNRSQARSIARALCLPDPFAGDPAGDFSQKHIQHLQKVIRGEIPDIRQTRQGRPALITSEEAKSPGSISPLRSFSPPPRASSTPDQSPSGKKQQQRAGGWGNHENSASAQSLAAYNRAHKQLQVSSKSLSVSASTPSLGTVANTLSPTNQQVRSTASALQLLQTSLIAQDSALAGGGLMSTESFHLSTKDKIQLAMVEEEEVARQLGVAPEIVHAHAGHGDIKHLMKKANQLPPPPAPTADPLATLLSVPQSTVLHSQFRVSQVPSPTKSTSSSTRKVSTHQTIGLGGGVDILLPKLPHS